MTTEQVIVRLYSTHIISVASFLILLFIFSVNVAFMMWLIFKRGGIAGHIKYPKWAYILIFIVSVITMFSAFMIVVFV